MVEKNKNQKVQISHLTTEKRNPKSMHLDELSVRDMLVLMNEEDKKVIDAIAAVIPTIEACVAKCISSIQHGGRMIYIGAGTSGRLGILDAVECVPTFSTTDEVIGIIAGGEGAFVKAVEGAEDSGELARQDLDAVALQPNDVVIALAASGRTPYAIGALEHAGKMGATCIGISCNQQAQLSEFADIAIEVDAGPEVLTGSTRLKAGTCQKLILNMISTTTMVGIGKVYENLMVDMKATNLKLVARAKRIVMESTGCDEHVAEDALKQAGYAIKTAIVMILTGASREEANKRIHENHGFVRKTVNALNTSQM